jgi:hypothetical protein
MTSTRLHLTIAVLTVAAVAAGMATGDREAPNYLTDRQRDIAGLPRSAPVRAQERLGDLLQCSDTTEATEPSPAVALAQWRHDLEAAILSGDPGRILESVSWDDQLERLELAAARLDELETRDGWKPTLAGMLSDEATEDAVFAYTSDCQAVAAEIARQCPNAKAEHVRVVAQEFARIRVLQPSHPASKQRHRMLTILCRESGCRPDAKNPRSTAMGLFQFLDSTCGWFGADPQRMRGTSPDDIRYQCRQAFALLTQCGWGQWQADPGPDPRDGGGSRG